MAYYRHIRNNVGYFIRNIICRRDGYANRIALAINIVLIVLQILNVYRAFVVNQKGTAIALIVCLFNHTHVDVGDVYMELELYS